MTGTFGSMPNMASSRSTLPTSLPAGVRRGCAGLPSSSLASPDCVADHDDAAVGPGHRAPHQQQALLDVGLDHLQVQGGDLLVAVLAGHLHALEHPGRGGALADGARRAMRLVVA